MLSKQRVDIVIPVYNDQAGIERCLAALEPQLTGMPAIRVLIVDNGSTPHVTIPEAQPLNVKVLRCATPGSYAARNAGAKNSDAELLVFLDADCEPQDGWLEQGLHALRESAGDCVVGGEVLFFSSERPTATEAYQRIVGFGQRENIGERGFSATANLFVERSVFVRTGPFDESLLSGGTGNGAGEPLPLAPGLFSSVEP